MGFDKNEKMKKFFVIVVVSLVSIIGTAQTPSATNLHVYLKPVNASGSAMASDALEQNPGNAPFNKITIVVELPTTEGISKINVSMGSAPSSSNLVNHSFDFDVTTGLPSGYSYTRTGNRIVLEVGTHAGTNHYTANVTLEDANGVESEVLSVSK